MSTDRESRGLTLTEILLPTAILSITVATLFAQVAAANHAERMNSARFYEATLQRQIEAYRSDHGGRVPSASLVELLVTTDAEGRIIERGPLGPYLPEIPRNPLNQLDSVVRIDQSDQDGSSRRPNVRTGGWLYDPSTGAISLNKSVLPSPGRPSRIGLAQ